MKCYTHEKHSSSIVKTRYISKACCKICSCESNFGMKIHLHLSRIALCIPLCPPIFLFLSGFSLHYYIAQLLHMFLHQLCWLNQCYQADGWLFNIAVANPSHLFGLGIGNWTHWILTWSSNENTLTVNKFHLLANQVVTPVVDQQF